MSEADIMRSCMLRLSKIGSRVFRNNVAQAWVGISKRIDAPMTVRLNIGDVVIRNARPLHAGLCNGSSDLIGWMPIYITADMVGHRIAVMTAAEVKTSTGAIEPDQIKFVEAVQQAGGIAGIVRSPDEAEALVRSYRPRP